MNKYLNEFKILLATHNKIDCLNYIKNLIKSNIPIKDIYNEILIASMLDVGLPDENDDFDIVTEHIYSNIIRTIIENCSEEICKSSKSKVGKTVLLCGVEGEMHDLPIKIVEDHFLLEGFNTIYLGSNTPVSTVEQAVKDFNIDYVAISVTNFYFLSKLNDLATAVKGIDRDVKVIVGGTAVTNNFDYCKDLNTIDLIIDSVEDISKLRGEE